MPIEHVFVLMLENRSFDHLFGLSQRQATPIPQRAGFGQTAPDRCASDPPHEFDNVNKQVNGGAMNGFTADSVQLTGFTAKQLPTLNELAGRYVLFDNWYSSVPGPTWPNRFFVHAATSGGLCTSPKGLRTAGAIIAAGQHFKFDNGTLFDLLDKANPGGDPSWRVYHGDVTPQCLSLPGMVDKYYKGQTYFRKFYPTQLPDGSLAYDGFANDLLSSQGYTPKYTFIEPNYALQSISTFDFTTGDSMHPCGLASAGDTLVRDVYIALSGSTIWESSILLVLWDEHGGFYDHVEPKTAIPPGDVEHNRDPGPEGAGFKFDQLGVRVPAILIGPDVPQGIGSEVFPGTVFDHASVVSTVRRIFNLGGSLTARDNNAPTFDTYPAVTVDSATAIAALTSKAVKAVRVSSMLATTAAKPASADVDGFAAGTALIAMHLDQAGSALSGQPTIGDFTPKTVDDFHAARDASIRVGNFPGVVAKYIGDVSAKAATLKSAASTAKSP